MVLEGCVINTLQYEKIIFECVLHDDSDHQAVNAGFFLLDILWIAENPRFLQENSEDLSDCGCTG